ncbi:MAG: protein tyrosine phosphatase, partial [Caecibacter massiliensis]|nr:protein tyrosine phosphatase [Caecibacter massiliensis]
WLHFHCEAGMGRTTAFMNMYDMMKNPSVPLKDILYREYEIGGNYTAHTVFHPSPSDWKGPYYNEKSRMIRLFYQYVQENYQTNFARSWSSWLKVHETEK